MKETENKRPIFDVDEAIAQFGKDSGAEYVLKEGPDQKKIN